MAIKDLRETLEGKVAKIKEGLEYVESVLRE